jgi:gluconokinase
MNKSNIVVMGVAGCGKSSLGRLLAEALDATFIEGDAFHPPENIARMSAGIPLTDNDRANWLAQLAKRLAEGRLREERMVLACSALKRCYRDLLREADPGLLFGHLHGDKGVITERMQHRPGHFMPTSLIDSQFNDLEALERGEAAVLCDITRPLDSLCAEVLAHLAGEDANHTF